MTHTSTSHTKVHEGRNVKRFREMLGIKQEALAADLGRRLEPAKDIPLGAKRNNRGALAGTDIGSAQNTRRGDSAF